MTSHSQWMTQLSRKTGFRDVPLFQLPIPGSHDTGTYGEYSNSGWARTQSRSVAQQLDLGIRFFDLRLRCNGEDYYIHHGLVGTDNLVATRGAAPDSISCILQDIRTFLRANPDEVIFLSCTDFESLVALGPATEAWSADEHAGFRKLLMEYLPLIHRRPICSLTLDSIYKSGRGRVIVLYQANDSLGDGLEDNFWDDRLAPAPYWEDKGSSLANDGNVGAQALPPDWIAYHRTNLIDWQEKGEASFFWTQAQMRPAGPGVFTVEQSAKENNPRNIDLFTHWMKAEVGGVPELRPNILTLDFIENGNLTEQIVAFFGAMTDVSRQYPYARSFRDVTLWCGANEHASRCFTASIPNASHLVGIVVRHQGSYGLVNLQLKVNDDSRRGPAADKPIPSDFQGWLGSNSDGNEAAYRCPPGSFIDGLQFASKGGHGMVNIRCHVSNNTFSNWLTPWPATDFDFVSPRTMKSRTGRITQIDVAEQDKFGFTDLRYFY